VRPWAEAFGLTVQWDGGTRTVTVSEGERALSLVVGQKELRLTGGRAKSIVVYNWGQYMDAELLREFTAETGVFVTYREYGTAEELYAVLKSGAAADVIITQDYMLDRLRGENMLQKLDFSGIPNYGLIGERFKKPVYDPSGAYTAAYMWGTVGIIYNTAAVSEKITSWGALFDPKYEGQLLMFDNPRDAFAVALKYLGYSLNTADEGQIREAYALLAKQKPLLQAYVTDQIFDKLEFGEAAIAPYYADSFLEMKENNPDLAFVLPDEGANMFADAFAVPATSQNKAYAERFINFMCGTESALKNMDGTGFFSANEAAYAVWRERAMTPEEAAALFPSDAALSKCEVFVNLPAAAQSLYETLWRQLQAQ
jgi:spermidine/putrescine transport system substrate-binding protein